MLKYITSNLENNKKFDGVIVQIYKRQSRGKTKRKRNKNLIMYLKYFNSVFGKKKKRFKNNM